MLRSIPEILPAYAARHEAARAVLSWLTAVPFERVTLATAAGTAFGGHLEQNTEAVLWARHRIDGRDAVAQGLLIRLLAVALVAEIVDVRVNQLPPKTTAARASSLAPSGALTGDSLDAQNELADWGIADAQRPAFVNAAKGYANQFVERAWFRTAVIAVGDRLLNQPSLLDTEVVETMLSTFPSGTPDPSPAYPPDQEVELAAYYRWQDTGRVPGTEEIHWPVARKGLRFLRACGG